RLGFRRDFNHDLGQRRFEARPISRSLCGTPQGRGKARPPRTNRPGDGNRLSGCLAGNIRHHRNSSAGDRCRYRPYNLRHLRSNNHGNRIYLSRSQFLAWHPGEVSGNGVATKNLNDSNTSLKTPRGSTDSQPRDWLSDGPDCHLWKRTSVWSGTSSKYSVFCPVNHSLDCSIIFSRLGCSGRGSITDGRKLAL